MTKEQEFRKQTEEAKFEAFSLMCRKVADLETKLKHAEEYCINKTCVVKLLELEAENACECRRCVYSDSPCILSDYGKDKNGICDHFKDVFEELKKWKDEWQEQVQKANDEGYARTLQTMQLNKARELLKEIVQHYKAKTIYVENMQDLLEQSEQFLKEVEK